VLDFLVESVTAHREGKAGPALIVPAQD